jgi:hypothetical protein
MPIRRAPEPTSTPDVYSIDFPIKPGESSINLTYTMPFTSGPFEGKTFFKGGGTSLIAPPGVILKGDNLESRGTEPRTQSAIFQVKGDSYKVEISGAGSLQRPQSGEADAGGGERDRISQILPKAYTKKIAGLDAMYWVLALALSILGLGFVTLLRAQQPEPAAAEAKSASAKKKR